jgi:hypothetical protein
MVEEWNERLACPVCHRVGMAALVVPEGTQTPVVVAAPDGFRAVMMVYGPDFQCAKCGVLAKP